MLLGQGAEDADAKIAEGPLPIARHRSGGRAGETMSLGRHAGNGLLTRMSISTVPTEPALQGRAIRGRRLRDARSQVLLDESPGCREVNRAKYPLDIRSLVIPLAWRPES